MKKLQCEVCGNTNIKKINDDVFECQGCGVHYSKNNVQQLLSEVIEPEKKAVQTVAETPKDAAGALKSADGAFNAGNFDKAHFYYSALLQFDPKNAFAVFMCGLSRAWQSKLTIEFSDDLVAASRKAEEMANAYKPNENEKYEFTVWMAEKITDFALSYQRAVIINYKEHTGAKALLDDTWKMLIASLKMLHNASNLIGDEAIAKIAKAEEVQKRICFQGNSIINQLLEKREYNDQNSNRKLAPPADVKKIADFYANYFDTRIFNLPSSIEERRRLADREASKKNYWQEHPEEYKAHLERKKKAEAKKRKQKIMDTLFVLSFIVALAAYFLTTQYFAFDEAVREMVKIVHLGSGIYLLLVGGVYFAFWLRRYILTMHDKK